jgi:hypothetical protein
MTKLIELLSGSENLYKYLFVFGLFSVLFNVYYPYDRKIEMAERVDLINKNTRIINYEIDLLDKRVKLLKKNVEDMENTSNGSESTYLNKLSELDTLKTSLELIDLKVIERQYLADRKSSLERSLTDYERYSNVMMIVGLVSLIFGGIKWNNLMKRGLEEDKSRISKTIPESESGKGESPPRAH